MRLSVQLKSILSLSTGEGCKLIGLNVSHVMRAGVYLSTEIGGHATCLSHPTSNCRSGGHARGHNQPVRPVSKHHVLQPVDVFLPALPTRQWRGLCVAGQELHCPCHHEAAVSVWGPHLCLVNIRRERWIPRLVCGMQIACRVLAAIWHAIHATTEHLRSLCNRSICRLTRAINVLETMFSLLKVYNPGTIGYAQNFSSQHMSWYEWHCTDSLYMQCVHTLCGTRTDVALLASWSRRDILKPTLSL